MVYTGTPCFIEVGYIVLHRCCDFKFEGTTIHQQKACFIVRLTLLP